jgi:hypothetical protein
LHYVNIALGCFVRVSGFCSFLTFYFTASNKISNKNKKAICCKWRWEGKTTEGTAWGVSKRAKSLWAVVEFCLRGNYFQFFLLFDF